MTSMFVERFTVPTGEPPADNQPIYDERLGYSVTVSGRPFVEEAFASTSTVTKADADPADADRVWETMLSVDTRTTAQRDRDRW